MPSRALGVANKGSPIPGIFPSFDFDLAAMVFAPGMDKRARSVFAAAPIVQGDWDLTGVPDVVSLPRGAQIGNPTDVVYANFDPHQGTASKWWTAEANSADLAAGYSYVWYVSADFWARYDFANNRFEFRAGGVTHTDAQAIVSGTLYHVVFSWDCNNALDGTDESRSSINDVHAYGGTGLATSAPDTTMYIGSTGAASPANAIIEGLRVDDFIWWDGAYGNYGLSMGVDLINYAYAAGAGADPALVIGSWGGKFCLPTDATPGAIVTGTGEAWSHPLASALLDQGTLWDGGVWGAPYAVEYNGTTTYTDCGSAAGLDNLPLGAIISIDVWVRCDSASAASRYIIAKQSGGTNGWRVFIDSADSLVFHVQLATTDMWALATNDFPRDGKWHLVTGYYDDATKTGRAALDGVWGAASVGVGAYQADAAGNLIMGRRPDLVQTYWLGGIGWVELSNNDRHGGAAGTDFVPPNAPYDDANRIESWHSDDGSGATLTATVTSPAHDGTINNGSWSSLWQDSGSPVLSQCLEFFQENDGINFGSGVNIDNLPSADCTIEFWARIPRSPASPGILLSKSDLTDGWDIRIATNAIRCNFRHAGGNARVDANIAFDDRWHHYAFDWDQGTLTLRSLSDGIFDETDTAAGAYDVDAAHDCLVNGPSYDLAFAIGWIRLSNNRRYTGTAFTPPDRHNPPANDANAHLLIDMTDGAGATATDSSGNGYNGTITFGATTRWVNDQDVALVSPGEVIFGNRGLEFGSDGANDGLVHEETVVAETDYVLMLTAHPGADGRGRFQVRLRDNTGAANIATVELPSYHGTHDGGAAQANLSDSTTRWLNNQINAGAVVYNITDGESATLGADPCDGAGTTITTTLSGGTWDNGDEYRIVWPTGGYRDHPAILIFCFKTPAACVSLQVFVEETDGEGTLYLHRVEIQENLLVNGDHESLNGGFPAAPELITGWANADLDAGDTEPEAATIHAGAQSLEWNPAAVNEGMALVVAGVGNGTFFSLGGWEYGDENGYLYIGPTGANGLLQYSTVARYVTFANDDFWKHGAGVLRSLAANPTIGIHASSGATGDRFSDDIYMFTLNDITLTITPASEANSLEGTGIRVDGYDSCTQLVQAGELLPNAGEIRWAWTPRHSDVLAVAFDATAWVMRTDGGVNNYIDVVWNVANNLRMQFNAAGAGIQIGNWATGGGAIVVGTTYQMRIRYWANRMRLYIDNVLRITINAPTGFVWPFPVPHYWGSTDTLVSHCDAVFADPS